ncbi:uncharacterized protein I303_100173 [Kwoniella dejecticola CBS 10117]|uniref:Transcriptional regulatory protein RXT2 N-terminal domain-containing protein n=1 Tax=Kwoniella dejecticola CBS 10117 TaxID=1296121 RepID=A0A1A6AE58_9TREE|nr:uncharacterized protein I303_00174 [Kwoniella dejecticola CBS 10117]OBR88361.1 hypothetical protein I303_00174 [Kwoniella dejecticola CBS 10117]
MPPALYHSSQPRFGGSNSQSTGRGKYIDQNLLDSAPSQDKSSYYDPRASPSASSSTSSEGSVDHAPRNLLTNSGNKLNPNARFMRRGKTFAWGPQYEEARSEKLVRKRLKLCLQQILPEAASEVGAQPPQNIIDAEKRSTGRKRKRASEPDFVLPHLRSPSPPLSTTKLAPMLALPRTYLDILISPSTRHTLGDDNMETGLQRTAGELLEGEKPLLRALGKARDVVRLLEADVPVLPRTEVAQQKAQVNGDGPQIDGGEQAKTDQTAQLQSSLRERDPGHIPPLPHISDTDNLWRVTQELIGTNTERGIPPLPPPSITYSMTPADSIPPVTVSDSGTPEPVPTPLQRLFTCPDGIMLTAEPNPNHPGHAYPPGHGLHPRTIKYNLDMNNQCRAVDDAFERLGELLADCNEYKERLEEARDRVADVARVRKKVWSVVRERGGWELDRRDAGKE